MGRPPRNSQGGTIYHVLCRGLKPKTVFRSTADYQEFDVTLAQAVDRFDARLLAYCALPKHWHLVLIPRKDGDLSKLMAWLTTTHSARWHTKPRRAGTGGLYERRFRSFPVQDDTKLLDIIQFVESHPLRSGMVEVLHDWPWSSLTRRGIASETPGPIVSIPPIPLPRDWAELLNSEMSTATLERIEHCIQRSCPYGDVAWVQKTAVKLSIESTLRPRGRPRKVV